MSKDLKRTVGAERADLKARNKKMAEFKDPEGAKSNQDLKHGVERDRQAAKATRAVREAMKN